MAVYLDKQRKTYYYDFKHNGKHYKKRGFRLKSEAADAERLALISLDQEPNKTLTVSQLVSLFLGDYKIKSDIDTYEKNEKRLNAFVIPFLGKEKITSLTPLKMNKWRENLSKMTYQKGKEERKYNSRTLNSVISLLHSVFKFGQKYYSISNNPTIYVDRFKDKNIVIEEKIHVWDEKQFDSFIKEVKSEIYVAFFTTIFWTGLRKGEARALRWNDIDFEKKTIRINKSLSWKLKGHSKLDKAPKTRGSYRTISVDETTLSKLKSIMNYYKKFQDFSGDWFVFGGNIPLANRTIDRVKLEAIEKANLPFIRLHDFRHSHASWLLWNGFNISYISKRLGHADISMTLQVYSHIINSLADESNNKLNQLRGGNLGEKP